MNQLDHIPSLRELKELLAEERKMLLSILTTQVNSNQSEWLSTSEVCEMLKIGRTTLHNWVKSGKIVAFRDPDGNRTYYSRDQINEYLKSCKISVR